MPWNSSTLWLISVWLCVKFQKLIKRKRQSTPRLQGRWSGEEVNNNDVSFMHSNNKFAHILSTYASTVAPQMIYETEESNIIIQLTQVDGTITKTINYFKIKLSNNHQAKYSHLNPMSDWLLEAASAFGFESPPTSLQVWVTFASSSTAR